MEEWPQLNPDKPGFLRRRRDAHRLAALVDVMSVLNDAAPEVPKPPNKSYIRLRPAVRH